MGNTVLNAGLVTSLLNNREFLRSFPEFMAVRAIATQTVNKGRGCSRCQKNSQGRRTLIGFYSVVRSLQPPRLKAFKERMKTDTVSFTMQRNIAGKFRSEVIKL